MTNVIDFFGGRAVSAPADFTREFWVVDQHSRRHDTDRMLFSAVVDHDVGAELIRIGTPLAEQSAAIWNSKVVQLRTMQPLPDCPKVAARISLNDEPETGVGAKFFETWLTRDSALALMDAAIDLGLIEANWPEEDEAA